MNKKELRSKKERLDQAIPQFKKKQPTVQVMIFNVLKKGIMNYN